MTRSPFTVNERSIIADSAIAHLEAIAAGDNPGIIAIAYADWANVNMVGTFLNGTYSGITEIQQLWSKFYQRRGKQTAIISNLEETVASASILVTVDLMFKSEQKRLLHFRTILLYRQRFGRIVQEIWQADVQ